MPIYDYKCRQCGQLCEVFVRSPEGEPGKCTSCGSANLEKEISAFHILGAGIPEDSTCCGRDTPCDSPPCSADDVCRRR